MANQRPGLTCSGLISISPVRHGSPQLLEKNERDREQVKKSWLILLEGGNYYFKGQNRIREDGKSGFLNRRCLSWGREDLEEDRIFICKYMKLSHGREG